MQALRNGAPTFDRWHYGCYVLGVAPLGESGKRGERNMSEENKALVRREMEELFNHTGNLDAVEEIISAEYVSYEPTSGETRGIEGARLSLED
jgi:hypothetical protein